jgi:SAM-dependent methyltransferase
MITYKCNPPYGNLGNRLFQAATIISLAKKYGTDYLIPGWQWNDYLKTPINEGFEQPELILEEPSYHYEGQYFDDHANEFRSKVVGIGNWLQTEKYFDRELVKEAFIFKEEKIREVLEKVGQVFHKPTIAISVRRGDFVGNPNHFCLPASYYYLALLEQFPDFLERYNLVIFSDDLTYCRHHFECLPNAYFVDGFSPIEQLIIGSACDHFIISNSTFSWWLAWLGEKPGSKIIRPRYTFLGKLFDRNGYPPDYYPERWTMFDHVNKKINLKDCTFTIPVFHDHRDRDQNLSMTVCMLQRDFETNIIIGEQGGSRYAFYKQWCRYHNFSELNVFHRTKMLNEMAVMAETPIVVNWDADVIVPPLQLWYAAERIKSGDDMVYPYDGRFARVPRDPWFKTMERNYDVGVFGNTQFQGKNGDPLPISSVGGAVFFNIDSFIDGGMENENFISYAPEDCERWDRFHALGYKVTRVHGCLYHFDHFIGENSSMKMNPHGLRNRDELWKVRDLIDKGQLRDYVNTWEWVHKYTAGYYEEISPGSITSRNEIFKTLNEVLKIESVIDVGCGVGQWGVGIEEHGVKLYRGTDYRIPKSKLLIPADQYAEFDLRSTKQFPFAGKYDLVLCMEVAEHIEERFAGSLVDLLTSLGDVVLFSAAIPNQGGRGHVNEQWQHYWARLFQDRGYKGNVIEDIRWNPNIEVWYRQNSVLYVKQNNKLEVKYNPTPVLPFVLPEMYMNVISSLKTA